MWRKCILLQDQTRSLHSRFISEFLWEMPQWRLDFLSTRKKCMLFNVWLILTTSRQKRRAEEKKLTAFVSNLSFKATTEEVEGTQLWQNTFLDCAEFFQANGLNPVNVTIATGPGGRSRGFGFVKFGSESEVQTAVTEVFAFVKYLMPLQMNNKPFQGRIIGVSPAREHWNSPPSCCLKGVLPNPTLVKTVRSFFTIMYS